MDKLITVLTFNYSQEAAVIRAKLESEEIEYFIADESTIQVYAFYSNAIGGVKLQVRQRDLPKTLVLLEEGGYLKKEDLKAEKLSVPSEWLIIIAVALAIFVLLLFLILHGTI